MGVRDGLFASAWVSCGCGTTVLPDGCVDVVWVDGELLVAGPATRAASVPASGEGWPFGVRLRTGAVEAVLGVPADVLRDAAVPLAALHGPRAREQVAQAQRNGPRAGLEALVEQVVSLPVTPEPDRMVREAIRRLSDPRARPRPVSGHPADRIVCCCGLRRPGAHESGGPPVVGSDAAAAAGFRRAAGW